MGILNGARYTWAMFGVIAGLVLFLSVDLAAAGVAAGTVKPYVVPSAALGAPRNVNVAAPPDYEKSLKRYPVLYLLHGYSDDHTTWALRSNVAAYAARWDVIVVMPDGGVSFYVNAVNDAKAKFEDFIVKDLVDWTDAHFRTLPVPRSRAVAGLSMGGYGAAFLGLKHHKRFSAWGSFSGALDYAQRKASPGTGAAAERRNKEMMTIFGPPGTAERKALDPFALIEGIPAAEFPLVYITCGGQDFLIDGNRAFVKALGEKKLPYEYRERSPQGHTWDFWDDSLREFLELVDEKPGWRMR